MLTANLARFGHMNLRVFAVLAFALLLLGGCSNNGNAHSPNDTAEANLEELAQIDSSEGRTSADNKELTFDDIPSVAILPPEEAEILLAENSSVFILDVQHRADYSTGRLNKAKNIPAGTQIDTRIDEIPNDKAVLIYDKTGKREPEVWQTLVDAGYDPAALFVLEGGRDAWVAAGLPYDDEIIKLRC